MNDVRRARVQSRVVKSRSSMASSGCRCGPRRSAACRVLLLATFAVLVHSDSFFDSSTVSGALPFRKCCPAGESLLKVNGRFDNATYECINHEQAQSEYKVAHAPLLVGKKYHIISGFPKVCDSSELSEAEGMYSGSMGFCVDKLISEIVDDLPQTKESRIVTLACLGKDSNTTTEFAEHRLEVGLLRKCCPAGQSYNVTTHVCRNDELIETDEWLISRLKAVEVYEVEYDMRCAKGLYGVELTEVSYELRLSGNKLLVKSLQGQSEDVLEEGAWCVEREAGTDRLVARGCTANCTAFGAYCVRKCCPMNYHFQPFSCNTTVSRCVPDNNNASSFNLSPMLLPLQAKMEDFPETVGIRVQIPTCSEGKYAMSQYFLTENAEVALYNSSTLPTTEYCLDTFDYTFCGDELRLNTLLCFPNRVKKDFFLSSVALTLSCIFMGLTLLVYGVLPELRNLHGKTLISHVSAMLLGYACLARVSLQYVPDHRLCAALGYGIYFGFVAAFAWLNVMCFDIWTTFGSIRTVQPMRKTNTETRRFLWYSLHAWGVAVALTVIMLLLDLYPVSSYLDANIGVNYCWFGAEQNSAMDWPHYIFFVIPMGIVTSINLVLWILTARHCARVRSEVHRMQAGSVGDRAKNRFRVDYQKYILTGKLWVVMGAGWVWEVVSTFTSEPYWFWTTVDLINCLQGLFIFIILVFKPKVYFLIKKRLGIAQHDSKTKGTASSGRTSSTFLSRTISGGGDERIHLRASQLQNQKEEKRL